MNLFALAAAVAMSASVLSVVPAQAHQSTDVSYADLDVATFDGEARLESRIKHAIELVCEMPDRRAPAAMAAFERCATEARTRVDVQLSARGIGL